MNHSNTDAATSTLARHVVTVVVYDGVKLLDVAGPADVFAEANRLGGAYRVQLVSPTGADVVTSVGIRLHVDAAPGDVLLSDTLLVAGGDIYPRTAITSELVETVVDMAAKAGRVASVCTGAFILAAGGLLDGKRATTHWKVAGKLAARHPAVQVDPDSIYIRDGKTYTSAGVSAGIDLALALLEEDLGPDLSRDVARSLVVYLQRAGGQSQFSAPLQGAPPHKPALRRVLELVTDDPGGDHSLKALAQQLNLSSRHLTRMFREELAITPARYVESIRFDIAKAMLDQGYNATEAAARAGFPSYESMRRVFTRELGIPPKAYQRRFRSALGGAPGRRTGD